MQLTTPSQIVGMNIAKNVFQLHVVDSLIGEIKQVKLKRDLVSFSCESSSVFDCSEHARG